MYWIVRQGLQVEQGPPAETSAARSARAQPSLFRRMLSKTRLPREVSKEPRSSYEV